MNFAAINNRKKWNRKTWLMLILILTVLAAIWPAPNRESIVSARGGARSADVKGKESNITIAFATLGDAVLAKKKAAGGDLFPSQSWNAPQPAIQQLKQTSPPPPFVYGGRYMEGNETLIFLSEGNQIYRAKLGDTIKDTYRVDKIESASITMTYLPLGTTQILLTGGLLQ